MIISRRPCQGIYGNAHKSVYCANDLANQVRYISDQADEKRVEIQRVEDTFYDIDKMAESDNKLKVDIDIGNGNVDLLNRNLYTSVDLHKACNFCVQVEIRLQLLYN